MKHPILCLFCAFCCCLTAADAPWQSKRPEEWTEQDARQILTASPWTREFTAAVARRLGEDELREAGQMGQPHGIGYDGVDPKNSGPRLPANIITGGAPGVRSSVRSVTLRLRWETALPVRIAELKAHEAAPATLESDGYCIAISGIPGSPLKGDPKQLGDPLRKEAVLRREGKTDVKPASVEAFLRDDGWEVVYLFPLSAEITPRDRWVEFEARVGRIVVAQSFDLAGMKFLGKLEL